MCSSLFATGACATALLSLTLPASAGTTSVTEAPVAARCTESGHGYLQAKIAGAIRAEIDWGDQGTTCTGEARPNGGVRFSFKNRIAPDQTLLVVFGIPGAQEGRSGRALPANVTVVREGAAEFYSTQGDDKCTIDQLEQVAIKGAPHRRRTYRVTVRGFCTEPARAVNGEGAVLLSRFDFASELHLGEEDEAPPPPLDAETIQSRSGRQD